MTTPPPRPRQPRRGRRPGSQDTRESILAAARSAFAERGFDGTSLRQIAAAAGVDAALIHHYFDSKEQLFLAAVQFPVDPAAIIARISDGPLHQLGQRVVDTFLSVWEDPTSGPALEAFLRGALANREASQLVQQFLTTQILQRLTPLLSATLPAHEIPTRATLTASQLIGLAVVRHVLRFEPLASTPRPAVVAAVAPTIQRYLTAPGSLDGLPTEQRDTPPQ